MTELTTEERLAIIKRRDYRDDIAKEKHPQKVLELHHKDRNRNNNDPDNIRVLTIEQHQKLHKRAGR